MKESTMTAAQNNTFLTILATCELKEIFQSLNLQNTEDSWKQSGQELAFKIEPPLQCAYAEHKTGLHILQKSWRLPLPVRKQNDFFGPICCVNVVRKLPEAHNHICSKLVRPHDHSFNRSTDLGSLTDVSLIKKTDWSSSPNFCSVVWHYWPPPIAWLSSMECSFPSFKLQCNIAFYNST